MGIILWRSVRRGRGQTNASQISDYANSDLVRLIVRRTEALLESPRLDDVVPGELLTPTLLAVAASPTQGPRVLDFGGGAGLHYLAAQQAFPGRQIRWAVVETTAMAEAATLRDDSLRFFAAIEPALAWLGGVDVMHSISAVQYLPKPEAMLDRLIGLKASVMFWGKLMLGDKRENFTQISRLRDNGPGDLPDGVRDCKVSYQATRLPREAFLAAHAQAGYRLAWKARESDSYLFLLGSP
jgi:putative methyltransferase (TIGR04325 family)